MSVRFVSILVISLTLLGLHVQAQERCATVPYTQILQEKGKTPENIEQFENWMQKNVSRKKQLSANQRANVAPYKIPVVVHVIHNGEQVGTGGNISTAQIVSQIDVLNADFKRLNADANQTPDDFLPVAGSLDIEFVLAQSSPDGLPTNGIVRVDGQRTSWPLSLDDELKAISYWPSEDYLNIWVTNISSPYLGYAQFPVSNLPGLEDFQDGLAETDGVVIDYTVFGVGSADPDYNLGRTTTHEVGHFFGLRHIWGDTDDCTGTDYVSDTPNQSDETYGCFIHPKADACSAARMFQNYMDYSDDECMNLYTLGQVSRMINVLENSPRRTSLLNSPGLVGLSGLGEDLKISDITGPSPVSCSISPAASFTITNLGSPAITSFKLVCTINETDVIAINYDDVNIPSGGEYNVSFPIELEKGTNSIAFEIHSPNNAADANPVNNDSLISVIVNDNTDIIPLREQFDNPITLWTIVNPTDGMKWKATSTNFNKSIYFNAFDNVEPNDKSWVVSPILDFRNINSASMFFDYSYAWNDSGNDRLMVLASTDCGETFLPALFNNSGTSLATSSVSTEWSPSTPAHWNHTYVNLNSLIGEENVRIAFVVTNAHGNNLFVDNIEFFLSDNPFPVDPGNDRYVIYWDESGGANITFNLSERQQVGYSIVDMMGKEIGRGLLPDVLNQTIPLPSGIVSTGLYVVRLQISDKYYSTKLYLSP